MSQPTAVVIGSGPGGLSAALHLARQGVAVTVLERAKQLGGLINPFARSHYEFDPGVHYMGDCSPGRPTALFFEELGIDARDVFCELDPDGFDRYRFPDLDVAMCKGAEAYQGRLATLFPSEERNLRRFFDIVRSYQVVYDAFTSILPRRNFGIRDYLSLLAGYRAAPYLRTTFGSLLETVFGDARLRAVLSANCGNYGLPPGRVSAFYALSMFVHFLNGGFFPRGGGRGLRDRLVSLAQAQGVTFLRRTDASRIVLRGGRVVAVETKAGESFAADLVVSALDPTVTFGQLIGDEHLPSRERRSVANNDPSMAAFCLYLGMKRDLRSRGFGAANQWHYPSWDLDALYEPLFRGKMWKDPSLFLTPNSIMDDSGSLAPAGGSCLQVTTFAPYAEFARWEGQSPYKRSGDYEAKKQSYTDHVLERVDRAFPGVVGDVVVCEASTPVTTSHYIASVQGGIYGPAATPEQSVVFRRKTRTFVPNLFLAGGGVFYGSGVAPALYSGRLAARNALARVRSRVNAPRYRETPRALGI